MRSVETLRNTIGDSFHFLHAKRRDALWRVVEALVLGGRLWLTALGRDMPRSAKEKHKIKAVDRLLGCRAVQAAVGQMYTAVARWLLRGMTQPVVLVDWTGCGPNRYLLSAGVPFGGRAILLHARVVHETQVATRKVHEEFLDTLAQVIPAHCRPIIVTDSGFYFHWFERVTRLNWDLVGRLRGRLTVQLDQRKQCIRELFGMASKRPNDLGVCTVGCNWGGRLRLVLASKPKFKGRTRLTRKGKRRLRSEDFKHSESAREPWLLATTLGCAAHTVIGTHATRMQLEESFRDLKSYRFG
ncbi:MAG: IS4 family transposase [Polyangiaceae bacterium]